MGGTSNFKSRSKSLILTCTHTPQTPSTSWEEHLRIAPWSTTSHLSSARYPPCYEHLQTKSLTPCQPEALQTCLTAHWATSQHLRQGWCWYWNKTRPQSHAGPSATLTVQNGSTTTSQTPKESLFCSHCFTLKANLFLIPLVVFFPLYLKVVLLDFIDIWEGYHPPNCELIASELLQKVFPENTAKICLGSRHSNTEF